MKDGADGGTTGGRADSGTTIGAGGGVSGVASVAIAWRDRLVL